MNPRTVKGAIKSWLRPTERDRTLRDLRENAERVAPSSDVPVVFCAPLMGKHFAEDWAKVSAGVARMVRSLLAQSDPNWTLLLTSQDRPEGLPDDPRIVFLPFEAEVTGMDKRQKVMHLMQELANHLAGRDGYLHALDADDILHPDVVAHIRSDNNGQGYWYKWGGMLDAETGTIARCGPRSLRYPTSRPFLSQCGSSAAIYVDFRAPERRAAEQATLFYGSGHRNFLRVTKALGLTLAPLPFPAGLYVMNTGENMRQKRGLMHRKMTYLKQNRLPEQQQEEYAAMFGLSADAPAPASVATRRG
ncbi:putative rhamnosyl transferase [Gymnodinialimonas ceratoperidinii]|uniref:Rhamnosyl transferase n=1 Tax=Gymnodinialimonas ceratoperidinii TaxID=2856823 RepID=A0A8F6YBF6_9RHOB|nr:putative rhamnosyl transferase [Gymnodinialimonas ceratoperidinii]QXT40508.1 putative rhamnosyl transferase [Gymnodinialimonas ceratoperidinii]